MAWQALLPIAGGILGNVLSQGDQNDAKDLRNRALAAAQSVETPDIEGQKLTLSPYQIQGLLEAINEQAETVGPSALENISTDPRLATAQMQALSKLQEVGAMGLTPAEAVQSAELQRQVDADEAVRQKGIINNMRARGVAGSGVEAAARLNSAEAAASRQAESQDRLRAEAFNRALQATTQAGQLGSNIRSQSFNEQDRVAQAKDAINQFNAQQRAGVGSRNTAAERARQASNLSTKQNISNANTDLMNTQQRYNKELTQRKFENEMSKARAAAGALSAEASNRQGDANSTSQMWSGIGSGLGGLLGSMGGTKPGASGAPLLDSKEMDPDKAARLTGGY